MMVSVIVFWVSVLRTHITEQQVKLYQGIINCCILAAGLLRGNGEGERKWEEIEGRAGVDIFKTPLFTLWAQFWASWRGSDHFGDCGCFIADPVSTV